ncbi:MAG: AAA family ATPase [Candidatus Brocadiaceae bacterium]|nr:AAA family ATPase [Candidatus Brocadiaceae bacterium]
MGRSIDKVSLKGFKSIEELNQFPVNKLNVLIGANGAGKTNFVDFFRMLRTFADECFQQFVLDSGGGDGFLFLGPKVTSTISSRLEFGPNAYEFYLKPTAHGALQITRETVEYSGNTQIIGSGSLESALRKRRDDRSLRYPPSYGVPHYVYESVSSWTVYHFHDTSPLASMRRDQSVRDWSLFRHDASNIAPFLLNLTEWKQDSYELIRDTVRLIAPFFDDFLLRPQAKGSDEQVRLEWRQKGSDFPFQSNQLSDGTMRFICLATALLQPEPPATVVIDEPELGLHPYAISILADLIKSASERTQVIISTQSPTLLDYFEPEEVVVVNRMRGRSTFERLDAENLKEWLEDYSVGELWRKNVVQGGPVSE